MSNAMFVIRPRDCPSNPFTSSTLPILLLILLVGQLLTMISPVQGQSPLPLSPFSSEEDLQQAADHGQIVAAPNAKLDAAHAALAERMVSLQESIDSFQEKDPTVPPPEDLVLELELLKWTDSLVVQRVASGIRIAQLQAEKEKLTASVISPSVWESADESSHSFLLLDDWEDQLLVQWDRIQASQFELQIVQELLETARDKFEASEIERRKTREAIEVASNRSVRVKLVRQHELDRIRSRMAAETLQKNVADVTLHEYQQELATLRSEKIQGQVSKLRQTVVFSPKDLQQKTDQVAQVENNLRQELQREQLHLQKANQQWSKVSQELNSSPTPDLALIEQSKTWKLAQEVGQEKISLINQVLQELGLVRVCWRYRYEVANHLVSSAMMRQWAEKAQLGRKRLEKFRQLVELHQSERQGDLAQLRKVALGQDQADLDRVRPWIEKRVGQIQQLLAAYDSQLALIKTTDRLVERFVQELQEQLGPSFSQSWLSTGKHWWVTCWNYELTSIDDRPITVSKVVRGLILLLVGYYLARTISRLLGNRILPRFGLDVSACMALQSVAFYVMLACAGYVSLEFIRLPLTIFTFMGGAIAIGVGFGSQNLLNNFMSGLILLAERPIRVGDLIDIDGLTGTIEHVGARSTRVKTGANLEIIVPNSKFLENNVTNWTLSDSQIRVSVRVGVAYGSSTSLVSRLLEQAIAEQDQILKQPSPIVLFKDFGDNSLNFEAHFWIFLRTEMDGQMIRSRVRHSMDRIFEQEGVVIAFPQQDVHLDMSSPLEINLRSVHELEQACQERPTNRVVREAA